MAFGRAPRTDIGTALLHAALLVSFLLLVATGLRLAADDPEAGWILVLDRILPAERVWSRHLVFGILLIASLAAFAIYVVRARLLTRTRLDGARVAAIFAGGKSRWLALGAVVVWLLICGLVVEIVTGVLLFLGGGTSLAAVHRWAMWACIVSVVLHIALHAAAGGVPQLLKVVRSRRLNAVEPPPDFAELLAQQLQQQAQVGDEPSIPAAIEGRQASPTLNAHPLATGLVLAVLVVGMAWGGESLTRPVLEIRKIPKSQVPVLDGELSEPVWRKARSVSVLTTQGGDFGGSHQSRVEIRAVHDGDFAYFAFIWEDPTRSLKHFPLVKRSDGWFIVSASGSLANEEIYHEDKFAVLLAQPGLPLIGAAIHLGRHPVRNRPAGASGRGLHFTLDGSVADVWQWRASHGGPGGSVENCHFGPPAPAAGNDSDEAPGYRGGFARDPGPIEAEANYQTIRRGNIESILPRRLPLNLAATRAAMGRIGSSAQASESEGARWWMTLSESIPYSPQSDAAIPTGSIIPGVFVPDRLEERSNAIRGAARWASGRWTLEVARHLQTGSSFDVPIKSGVLMWVAAFDHSEKRHTRHLRAFRIEVK